MSLPTSETRHYVQVFDGMGAEGDEPVLSAVIAGSDLVRLEAAWDALGELDVTEAVTISWSASPIESDGLIAVLDAAFELVGGYEDADEEIFPALARKLAPLGLIVQQDGTVQRGAE
jgi:hypothetical protein